MRQRVHLVITDNEFNYCIDNGILKEGSGDVSRANNVVKGCLCLKWRHLHSGLLRKPRFPLIQNCFLLFLDAVLLTFFLVLGIVCGSNMAA